MFKTRNSETKKPPCTNARRLSGFLLELRIAQISPIDIWTKFLTTHQATRLAIYIDAKILARPSISVRNLPKVCWRSFTAPCEIIYITLISKAF